MRTLLTRCMLVVLLCAAAGGVAQAVDAPAFPEFPARRWTGARWKTLTGGVSGNARLVAYHKATEVVGDTATAAQVVCSYNSATAQWYFAPTETGTWWVWDQQSTPDSLIAGASALFCVGPTGIGTGGDITEVNNSNTNGGYLFAANPTGPGAVSLGVNLGSESTVGSFDYRYLNESGETIDSGLIGKIGLADLKTATAAVAGEVLKATGSGGMDWGSVSGVGTVVGVHGSHGGYLTVTDSLSDAHLSINTSQLDTRYIKRTGETEDIATTAGTVTGGTGLKAGTAAVAGYLDLTSGGNIWTTVKSNASAPGSYSMVLPTAPAATTAKVLTATATTPGTGGSTTLGWTDAGTGIVNSITAGSGITVTGNGTATPTVALTTTTPLWIKQSGETRPTSLDNTLTADGLYADGNVVAGSVGVNGGLVVRNSSAWATTLYNGAGQAGNVSLYLPATQGTNHDVVTTDGVGHLLFSNTLDLGGDLWCAGTMSNHSLFIRNTNGGTFYNAFKTPNNQAVNAVYTMPYLGGPTANGSFLRCDSDGTWRWTATYTGFVQSADTLTYEPGKGGGQTPTGLKYYKDLEFAKADSADIANGMVDNSYLVVDTMVVALLTEYDPLTVHNTIVADSLYSTGNIAADGDISASAGTISAAWGDFSATVNADEGYFVAGHWILNEDSLWTNTNGLFEHRVTIGSNGTTGHGTDGLTVNGQLNVTGSYPLTVVKDIQSGDASNAGALLLSDGSSNTLRLQTPAMAANDTLTFPAVRAGYKDSLYTAAEVRARIAPIRIFAADTLLLSTARTLWGDRLGSKYIPGVTANAIVTTGLASLPTAPALQRIQVYTVTDSLVIGWTSTVDNAITTYIIIKR